MDEGKRYPILLLKERTTRNAAWMRMDEATVPELEAVIGRFVLSSLKRFRLKCFEAGETPDIRMVAVILDETDMAALELETWRCDLEEMCKDVERGTEK